MRELSRATLVGLWFMLPATVLGQACQPPVVPKGAHPSQVPLCLVADQVIKTLDAFNNEADSRILPKLSTVTFDFHTSASKTEGLSFQILVFNLGVNHERDSSNDVSFTYTVPSSPVVLPRAVTQTQDFSKALLGTLADAAAQVKQTESVGAAKFSNLTITLSYGVVWDTSGGGSGTVALVTLNGSMDRKRTDVQTLTLMFGP